MRPGRATPRRWQAPVTGATVTSNDVKIRPWRPAPRPSPRRSTRSALRRLLDGPHRMVREHTRAILARDGVRASRTSSSRPRSTGPRSPSGPRVLASTGGPALLFPEEFGGLGRVGEAIASFETLALSDLSLLVKCGVQFGLFGGAVHHLGTRKHHERYLRAGRHVRAARRLRDERVGPRIERPAGADDRDLRRRGRRARDRDADRRRPQGLHRQRRARRPHRRRLLPARGRRREARRALRARAAPRRGRRGRRRACGSPTAATSSASTASTTAASGSTASASRARTCSTATRRSARTASTTARSRTRTAASSRCSAR